MGSERRTSNGGEEERRADGVGRGKTECGRWFVIIPGRCSSNAAWLGSRPASGLSSGMRNRSPALAGRLSPFITPHPPGLPRDVTHAPNTDRYSRWRTRRLRPPPPPPPPTLHPTPPSEPFHHHRVVLSTRRGNWWFFRRYLIASNFVGSRQIKRDPYAAASCGAHARHDYGRRVAARSQ